MGFALAGKKTDNSIVLTEGYTEKRKSNGKGMSGRKIANNNLVGAIFCTGLPPSAR
jgi:CRISPR system Cascade subunit CasA